MKSPFTDTFTPDWEGLYNSITRKSMPRRVHHIELFLDPEIQDAICLQYGILEGLDPALPDFPHRKAIALARFLGYDFVRCGVDALILPFKHTVTDDTAGLSRSGGRTYIDENRGPITNWDEFEQYPWPNPDSLTTQNLEWFDKNLPDDMCVIAGGGFAHYAEHLAWLMRYATFCLALCEQRDLVQAIYDKIHALHVRSCEIILQHPCVKIMWGSDDMGFKSGPLISPPDMKEFVLEGHRVMAKMSHDAGKPYLLHSCGNLSVIMDDLIDFVQIDAKHSFEDTIEQVTEVKHTYGKRIALLGGIDVDFLCRATEAEVRNRVKQTLDICMPGGGYCLGSGNSVANYIPLENYLAMVDEGRRYTL